MTILKLGKDSPESGEHPRYPESMSGVPRTDFLMNFQNKKFGTSGSVRRVGTTLENGINNSHQNSFFIFSVTSRLYVWVIYELNIFILPVFSNQNVCYAELMLEFILFSTYQILSLLRTIVLDTILSFSIN